ncbi:hypothetical protein NC796_07810 [Aliifodinibius sp. S!AR15-10]|uniref:hypothetical protein n=1 Tax=Aliifodinibius sp. S!AR15-10 TaxID=2950437 RepID=UPI00285A8F43|nr:hypothetical protein [Aliifodinibius sp. S!AR15-10]MDR8391038.1 hypothetical protein [Aliifodinibius sp. S!AR15-10]
MKITPFRTTVVATFLILFFATSGWSQDSRGYELLPYPDVWYNDVDGIRVGARLIGQVPGTFGDGPHRLNAGVWLGTWWPENPVSYNFVFTEPIPSISGFNSEGNVQLLSSVRTGLSRHSIRFNKRWQPGFNEYHYFEISAGLTTQKRFDLAYTQYPNTWQQDWLWLGNLQFRLQNENGLGRYRFHSDLSVNMFGDAPSFTQSETQFVQRALLGKGFVLRGRLFAGIASNQAVPEFLFGRSFRSTGQWVQNSLVRAKGTIPTTWMDSGIFQVAGGANLRGYSEQDISALERGQRPLLTSVGSVNIEIDYPNPVDHAIKKIPTVGKLMQLRSYLFNDTGTSLGLTGQEESRVLSDAGLGFMLSLNIPDYLGNPRGLMLRYDIPLWLSHPEGDQHFSYRSVVGVGAIFTF